MAEEKGIVLVEEFLQTQKEANTEDRDAIVKRSLELFKSFKTTTAWYKDKLTKNRELYKQQAIGERSTPDGVSDSKQNSQDLAEGAPFTTTPVLLSSVENLKADLMNGYPEAVFVAREAGDAAFANTMNALYKALLERRCHRSAHQEAIQSMLVYGTGWIEPYWDDTLEGGKGDVAFSAWEPFNIFPDPFTEDVQEGRAVFKVTYHPISWFKEHYPDEFERMQSDTDASEQYVDQYDLIDKSDVTPEALIEMWYKKYDAKTKKTSVHMLKIAGGVLLYMSEDEFPDGVYPHGQYPFVPYMIDRIPGLPFGYGLYDYLGNMQRYIDRVDQLILKNIVNASKMRMLVSRAAGLNPDDVSNFDKDVVIGDRIDDAAVRFMQGAPISDYALTMLQLKTETLRDESGQNNSARGLVGGGITAASAITSMQSAAMKRSDLIRATVDMAFEKTVRQVVALMLKNYEDSRAVRIEGDQAGMYDYYQFGDIKTRSAFATSTPDEFEYDLTVKVQVKPSWQQQTQNETVLELIKSQVLPPELGFELMHFDDKPRIIEAMRWNSQMRRNMEEQAAQSKAVLEQATQAQQENEALRNSIMSITSNAAAMGVPTQGMPLQ